jgi:hypothetical protein
MGNDYQRLHDFVNQEDLWEKQIAHSNEYKWSQNCVKLSLKESTRSKDEHNTLQNSLSCYKLYNRELNSLNEIFAYLEDGNIDLVFNRIQSHDSKKQGIIYILIIHELTVGKLKYHKNKQELCFKVINQINAQSESIELNNEFIPALAIYNYHIELSKFGIDDSVLWYKTLTKESEEKNEDGFNYLIVDVESLLTHNVDLKIIEKLAIKYVTIPNDFLKVIIKIIYKYSSEISISKLKENKKEIHHLLDTLTKYIKRYYTNSINDKETLISQENFEEFLNILITNDLTNEVEGYINMYSDLYLKNAEANYEEDPLGHKDLVIEGILKSSLVFFMRIGKYERAIETYKKLNVKHIQNASVIEICKQFFEQKKINELITFLNTVEDELQRIESLIEICSLLINNKREYEALELILNKKNKYQIFPSQDISLYNHLLQIKESKSLQERFNCRNLYFKTFMILNSIQIDEKSGNIDKYFFLHETIYLISCMKNKLSMSREFNDLLSKILSIKQNKEIDDAIKKIITIVDSEIIKIENPLPKRSVYLDFLFNLFKYDINISKKHLNNIVESHRAYCGVANFPAIISHAQIWDNFLSRYEELCKSSTLEAIKIIEFKIYPMVNYLPGKNLESPLHKRIILGLIDQKKTKEALEYYNKHKNLTIHKEFYLSKIIKDSITTFFYENFLTKEIFSSDKQLFDQIFSLADLESILLRFKKHGFFNEAKLIFEDIKIIYPNDEKNLYQNIIFNGLFELDEEIEEAYTYLKTFHVNNQHLYIDFSHLSMDSKKESMGLKRKNISLLGPNVLKKLSSEILSSCLNIKNAQKIFLTTDRYGTDEFYSQLYSVLNKYNKLHLTVKDILESNIRSPYFDSSQIISNSEYMFEHDLKIGQVFFQPENGSVINLIRCKVNELQKVKKVTYYDKTPFTGVAYDIYSNYTIKYETHYKNGFKNGLHINYNRKGEFVDFMMFKDGEIDLNCFSKSYALSEFIKKLKSIHIIKNNNDLLEIIKNELVDNNLYLELKKVLETNDLKSNKKTLSEEILSKLEMDDGNWRDFKDWERLVSEFSIIDKIKLNKILSDINLNKLVIKCKLKKTFEINNDNRKDLDITLKRVNLITNNIRSLVWMAELLKTAGKEEEAVDVLIIAKDNHELYYNEDLITLIERAHLDSTFYSIKILVKKLLEFNENDKALAILKKITKEFSIVIEGGKTKWENWDKRIPTYGEAQFELYNCYLELIKDLWITKKNKILNNIFSSLKNKYWIYGIKKELFISDNNEFDKNETKLLSDLLTLNSEIEIENSIQSYAVISNFNLYVEYASHLISKKHKNHAKLILNNAKEIKEKYDDDFQLSIRSYNEISDADDFWYEKEKTITPDLDKFYLNMAMTESTSDVVAKIISEESKEFVDEINGEVIQRKWKNNRWKVKNCYDLISKIYFDNNEFNNSFKYSLKIIDNRNRTDQFKLIFDNIEIEDCIRCLNSNQIEKNDEPFFSNYLSKRIKSEFTTNGLEFIYLNKFNNHIEDLLNVFEYKAYNYCLHRKNSDNRKTDLLNEVLDFNELEKIKNEQLELSNN